MPISSITTGSICEKVTYRNSFLKREFSSCLSVCLGLPRKYPIPVYPFADNAPICCHCHVDTRLKTPHRGGTAASSRLKREQEREALLKRDWKREREMGRLLVRSVASWDHFPVHWIFARIAVLFSIPCTHWQCIKVGILGGYKCISNKEMCRTISIAICSWAAIEDRLFNIARLAGYSAVHCPRL